MAATNYKGVEAVCKYIESTKLAYFGIFPVGRTNAKPVYKQSEKIPASKAAEKFRDWAGVILDGDPEHSMVYELRLYDSKENNEGEEEILSGRSGMAVTFSLASATPVQNLYQQPAAQSMGGISMEMYLALLNEKNEALRQVDRLTFEMTNLKKQLLEAEEELADMEEESGDDVNGIGGIAKMFMPMLASHFNGGATPANINGTPDQAGAACDCQRCKHLSPKALNAINDLKRYDEELDHHLVLLAKIAKTNPGQWAFLTNALNNM